MSTVKQTAQEHVIQFYENFEMPKGIIIPKDFPVCRGKSVLVKKEDRAKAATKMGIIIPETAATMNSTGRVYSIGPEVNWLKPGMRVIYNFYANQYIIHDGIEYLLLSEIDIFCILPENDITGTAKLPVEKRRQYSVDELPSNELTKEEKQENEEFARETAEGLKKHATRRQSGYRAPSKK